MMHQVHHFEREYPVLQWQGVIIYVYLLQWTWFVVAALAEFCCANLGAVASINRNIPSVTMILEDLVHDPRSVRRDHRLGSVIHPSYASHVKPYQTTSQWSGTRNHSIVIQRLSERFESTLGLPKKFYSSPPVSPHLLLLAPLKFDVDVLPLRVTMLQLLNGPEPEPAVPPCRSLCPWTPAPLPDRLLMCESVLGTRIHEYHNMEERKPTRMTPDTVLKPASEKLWFSGSINATGCSTSAVNSYTQNSTRYTKRES